MTAKVIKFRSYSLQEAVHKIHGKFQEAIDCRAKAFRARLAAGQMLLDLRRRIEAGEAGAGVEWWPWYEQNFVRSRRDAEKVMKMARSDDPEAALDAEQAARRDSMQRHRGSAAHVGRTDDDIGYDLGHG